MQKLTKFVAVSALSMAVLVPVFAIQHEQYLAGDFSIRAYKDCDLVYEQTMSQEQFEAYTAFKKQEEKMRYVHLEFESIEGELELHTSEIEEITSLAIHETDDMLYIDKHMLKQQEESAQRLEEFMSLHENVFQALGEYGASIGESATRFTQTLESDLYGIDYDNIQVITPEDDQYDHHCDTGNNIHIM